MVCQMLSFSAVEMNMMSPQKQLVVQLLPTQQVVHVTILPLYMIVRVEHAAHVAVAVAANAIAMIAFFMMTPVVN